MLRRCALSLLLLLSMLALAFSQPRMPQLPEMPSGGPGGAEAFNTQQMPGQQQQQQQQQQGQSQQQVAGIGLTGLRLSTNIILPALCVGSRQWTVRSLPWRGSRVRRARLSAGRCGRSQHARPRRPRTAACIRSCLRWSWRWRADGRECWTAAAAAAGGGRRWWSDAGASRQPVRHRTASLHAGRHTEPAELVRSASRRNLST